MEFPYRSSAPTGRDYTCAGTMKIPDLISIEILPDYMIRIEWSNGRTGVFDVTPYLDRGIFTELKDYSYFRRARIEHGTIVRPNDQDFTPETIEIQMMQPGNLSYR